MDNYLIDNNIISSYFAELFQEASMKFIANVIDQSPNLSVITAIEALSWINLDKGKEEILKAFIADSNILYITSSIVDECVKIRATRPSRAAGLVDFYKSCFFIF